MVQKQGIIINNKNLIIINMKSNISIIISIIKILMLCVIMGKLQSVEAYKNYTVGDSLGWYDNTIKPVDYAKWISGKSFSLGDFLIFNTDNNHTVIQTYDLKTYNSCDNQGDDIVHWSSMDPNTTTVQPFTVAVPLIKEGPTYFFSGDYEGEQCQNGQKFAINVTHGKGLPPDLRNDPTLGLGPTSSNSAPGPTNADAGGDDQAAPDTVVPADFNHPKKVPNDDSTSNDSGDDDSSDDGSKKSNDANFMFSKNGFLLDLISGILIFVSIY